ncbi:hypothetical protein [Streptococcus hyovaginalis]|uniref:hypothetical protein n=1 Tax=Streptococcus hyovaginalis TaxID=149015 RepID=UPI0014783964|nr:hypothetical protein [Streptococcus hyovaginalis]
MKKEEWLEYFEAINGRSATDQELAQALANGEFEADSVPSEPIAQQVIYDVAEEESVEATTQTAARQSNQEVILPQEPLQSQSTKANSEKVKHYGKNYFSWLVKALKNPQVTSDEDQFVFGSISLVLAAALLAGALLNYIRRFLFSIINLSTPDGSIKTDAPEVYDRLNNFVSSQFGLGKWLYFFLLLLLVYGIAYTIPALLDKSSLSFKERFGKLLGTAPLLLVLNAIAFLVTFLVKDSLLISSEYVSRLSSTVIGSGGELNEMLSGFSSLIREIPALQSLVSVATYLLILTIIGLIVLLVSMIKTTSTSVSALNSIYTTIVSVLVFLIVVYFLDKLLLSSVLDSLSSLKDMSLF